MTATYKSTPDKSTPDTSMPDAQADQETPPAVKIRRKTVSAAGQRRQRFVPSQNNNPISPMPPMPSSVTSVTTGPSTPSIPPVTSVTTDSSTPSAGENLPTTVRHIGQEPGIENGYLILHRSPNFYVRTTNRKGQRPNPLRRRTGYTALMPRVAPEQEQRIATSDTRLLPNVTISPARASALSLPTWVEAMIVVIGLIASFIVHAINLFNYPSYTIDEGTYMSSAWSVLHGSLWPYAYGYGHPPLAWIQIAAWTQLTGGLFAFGNAINSGRVLMTFYAVGSSLLVYLIFRRLNGSRSAAVLAMIIFSLSPLCINYQRQVLLDNVATFWLLLSLYLLVIGESRLLYIVLSAIAFGIALLSKEVLLLFFPVMVYAVWLHTTRFQRKFALVAFIYSVVALGSGFVLMAVLKGELLPPGWFPWDHHPHLSLLSTYIGQVQRGQSQGNVLDTIKAWMHEDALLIVASAFSILFNLIAGWRNRKLLMLSLFSISFLVLFVRNGVVYSFYIIPLLPFCALNIAATVATILQWLNTVSRTTLVHIGLIGLILAAIIVYDANNYTTLFTENLTGSQTQALAWVRNNIPHNAVVVINAYLYTDLHESDGEGVGNGTIYPYAHIYWNVAFDPAIHDTLLQNDWSHIDYIVTDTNMIYDIDHLGGGMALVETALQHASLRADFRPSADDAVDAIQIYQVNHTNPSPFADSHPTVLADLSRPGVAAGPVRTGVIYHAPPPPLFDMAMDNKTNAPNIFWKDTIRYVGNTTTDRYDRSYTNTRWR